MTRWLNVSFIACSLHAGHAIEGRVRWVGDFELVLLAKVLRTGPADLLPRQVDWSEVTTKAR